MKGLSIREWDWKENCSFFLHKRENTANESTVRKNKGSYRHHWWKRISMPTCRNRKFPSSLSTKENFNELVKFGRFWRKLTGVTKSPLYWRSTLWKGSVLSFVHINSNHEVYISVTISNWLKAKRIDVCSFVDNKSGWKIKQTCKQNTIHANYQSISDREMHSCV